MISDAKLNAVRDLLLPALHIESQKWPGIEFDIDVDPKEKCLVVKGYNREKKRNLGFAITSASIVDQLYIGSFKPCLDKLAECLNQEDEPVGT